MNTQSLEFSQDIFSYIVNNNDEKNIIISPYSIRSCLALAFLAAEAETATVLQKGLKLKGQSKEQAVGEFAKALQPHSSTLKIANRIYASQQLDISSEFNKQAQQYFDAAAESVNFVESSQTAAKINQWVSERTNAKIQELIEASSLNENTAAVLVNAIYFHADWLYTFQEDFNQKKDFHNNETSKQQVDMMFQEDYFQYAVIKQLNAAVLEMPYKDSEISMLIILPQQLFGLKQLEQQLKNINLLKLQLQHEKVRVKLPKFKMEFDISLKRSLEQMGMSNIFSRQANFKSLLSNPLQSTHISEVKHKAFIEVNEKGTTAAGATFAKISLDCLIMNETIYDFCADHPFFFAIKDKENVYFMGHVVNI